MDAEWIGLLQWPAMAATLAAAWLVGSRHPAARNAGFWTFIASNALWIAWGLHDHAYALIALQVGLAILNIRGAKKAEEDEHEEKDEKKAAQPAHATGARQ